MLLQMAADGPELRVCFAVPAELCRQTMLNGAGASGWAAAPAGQAHVLESIQFDVGAAVARRVLMAAPSPMAPAINQ
eukprot:66068-Chlamydomonas_euryale.AAC.6